MPTAPLRHVSGSTVTTVVDPRFGTDDTPTQPPGWGGTGGGGGSIGTYSGGVRGEGFHVPPGALSNLTAALANGATDQRVEIAYIGDSTGWGSGPDETGGPPLKLRELLLAAGLPDGGAGMMRQRGIPGVTTATTFSDSGKMYTVPPAGVAMSITPGETYTFTGPGTAYRFIGWNLSTLTYTVDGGATQSFPASNNGKLQYHYVSGLAAGSHTIVVTNATGTPANGNGSSVMVEALNSVGVVVHQDSVSGGKSGNYFAFSEASSAGTNGNNPGQYLLGQVIGGTNSLSTSPPAARPAARNVKAAIWALGLNNMSDVSDADVAGTGPGAVGTLQEDFSLFVNHCRHAGCDPILAVPHFRSDSRGWKAAGKMHAALVSAAEAHGVAWCDYDHALHAAGIPQQSNPHLPQSSYDAEAQFLFDNVLSLALPA